MMKWKKRKQDEISGNNDDNEMRCGLPAAKRKRIETGGVALFDTAAVARIEGSGTIAGATFDTPASVVTTINTVSSVAPATETTIPEPVWDSLLSLGDC